MKWLILFVVFFVPFGVSGEVVRDVEVSFLLDIYLEAGNYSELWQITNLDHVSGSTDSLNVFVDYVFNNVSGNYTRSLNRFTRAGGPVFEVFEDQNFLCVNVTPLNFVDPFLENNFLCVEFFVGVNPDLVEDFVKESSFCDCDFELLIESDIIRVGESVRYKFDFCSSVYPYDVFYWVEDLQGNVVRSVTSTKSSGFKSYTPRHNFMEKTYRIFGEVKECGFLVSGLFSSFDKEKLPFLEVRIPEFAYFGDYFFVELEGLKDSSKRVLEVYVQNNGVKLSEVTKLYVNSPSFGFSVPVYLFDFNFSFTGVYELVVEGLDFYHSESIFLIGRDAVILEEDFFVLEPRFNNFYYRKQKFDGKVTFFYNVENVFSDELVVFSSAGRFSKIVDSRTGSIDVSITHPREVIVANIFRDFELVDSWYLVLNLSFEDGEEESDEDFFVFNEVVVINVEDFSPGRFRRIFGRIFGF